MTYKSGECVRILKTNQTKKILESEIILGVEIYYMTDKTSYCLSDICEYSDHLSNEVKSLFIENIDNLTKKVCSDKIVNNWIEILSQHKPKK